MSAEIIQEYWKTGPSYVPTRFDIVGATEKYEGIDELEDALIELNDFGHVFMYGAGTSSLPVTQFVNKTASTVEPGLRAMFAMMTDQQPKRFVPVFTKKPIKRAKLPKEVIKKVKKAAQAAKKIARRRGGDDSAEDNFSIEDYLEVGQEPAQDEGAIKFSEIDDFELGQILRIQDNELGPEIIGGRGSAPIGKSVINMFNQAYDVIDDEGEDEDEDLPADEADITLERQLEDLRNDYKSAVMLDGAFHQRVRPHLGSAEGDDLSITQFLK